MEHLRNADMDLSGFQPYKINCEKCCGLCCVALYFSKAEGFPEDKNPGTACRNLQPDYQCKVHAKLLSQGLKGCVAYDCFGAGQLVTSRLSQKPDWISISSEEADRIFHSFLHVMQIHQILWYLTEALLLKLSKEDKERIHVWMEEGEAMTAQSLEALHNMDTEPYRQRTGGFLQRICSGSEEGKVRQNKNYMGRNMRRKNLVDKDFSMSLLIAADLEEADLRRAGFLGADMRDANIKNTDLSPCLFLTQMQINGAKGNKNTTLPFYLCKPGSWS